MGLEALFLTGVNVGFMPAGYYLGGQIAGLPYRWILVPLAMVIGFYIVPLSIKKAVMQSICSRILEKSGEHGIVFSIPVDEALGLCMPDLPNRPNA